MIIILIVIGVYKVWVNEYKGGWFFEIVFENVYILELLLELEKKKGRS